MATWNRESVAQSSTNTYGDVAITGDVGIGTTTPASPLEIKRTDTGDYITFDHNGTDVGTVECASNRLSLNGIAGGNIVINQNAIDVDFQVKPDTGHGLFLEGSSGKVGIGTITPSTNLHIYDDTDNAPNIYLENVDSDSNSGGNLIFRSQDSNGDLVDNQIVGDLVWQGYNNSKSGEAGYDNMALIRGRVDGTPDGSDADMPGELAFYTTADDGALAQRMAIRSSGNIGIGTGTPSTALQVSGTVTATTFAGNLTGNVTGNLAGNVTGSNWTGTLNISGTTTVAANLSSMYSNSGGGVSLLAWNQSGDDDSSANLGLITVSNNADVYCSFMHSMEDDPDEKWSLGVDGSSDTFKLSYAATNGAVTPSASASYDLMNITKAGVVTIPGSLIAKQQVNIPSYMAGDINTSEMFISLQGYATMSAEMNYGHNYVFPCNGVLKHVYFIANDWNPNDSSNTQSWKCYRFRPDGSTNTGAYDTKGNWTVLETVSKANGVLQAQGRGIFVDFTDSTCSFNKGDLMGISLTNSVDVTDSVTDQITMVVSIELDWNNALTGNI